MRLNESQDIDSSKIFTLINQVMKYMRKAGYIETLFNKLRNSEVEHRKRSVGSLAGFATASSSGQRSQQSFYRLNCYNECNSFKFLVLIYKFSKLIEVRF